MPDDTDTEPLILDGRLCRILDLLRPDAPRVLELLAARHRDEIVVTPSVAGAMLGISERAVRRLVDRGAIPTHGAGRHRLVPLSAPVSRGLDAEVCLEDAVDAAREDR